MRGIFYKAAGAIIAPFRYAEREAKNVKEHLKEDFQKLVETAIKITVAAVAAMLFLLFISIGVANLLNHVLNSAWAGYAIVGGFYLLVAVVVYAMKVAADKKREEEKRERKARELAHAREIIHAH